MQKPAIVYGTQYYRSPTPESCDWEKDLKKIRRCGMNAIKLYVMWRWHNAEEGKYDFSDLNAIFKLAGKEKLWLVVNVILCTPPAWIFRKYPDAYFVNARGLKLYPFRSGGYQPGGMPGMCYHHPAYKKEAGTYLKRLVSELGKHENLLAWDLWNEPAFNYSNHSQNLSDIICYCPHTEKAFKSYLKKKYGTIKKLNLAWRTRYPGWDDVELPRSTGIYTDMIDWRIFNMVTLGEEQRWRCGIVREMYPEQEVMCHMTATSPFGDPVNRANDDWLLNEPGDIVGSSGGICEFVYPTQSIARAQKKNFWISEFPYMPGSTFVRPRQEKTRSWLKEVVATTYLAGASGLLYWQFRPERLGMESPTYGAVNTDGTDATWTENIRDLGSVIKRYGDEIASLKAPEPDAAIAYTPEGMIFNWCATGNTSLCMNESFGFTHALMSRNISFDFLHIRDIKKQLSGYKVLYLPFPNWISEETHLALLEFVRQGGILFSGPFYGQFNPEEGLHARKLPGYGAEELFGCTENAVQTDPAATPFLPVPRPMFVNKPKGKKFQVSIVETFNIASKNAKPFLYFEGKPCGISHRFGRGTAFISGVYLGGLLEQEFEVAGGHLYGTRSGTFSLDIISLPLSLADCRREPAVKPFGVIIRSITNGRITWLGLINKTGRPAECEVSAPGGSGAEEVFDGEKNPVRNGKFKTSLDTGETKIFRVS